MDDDTWFELGSRASARCGRHPGATTVDAADRALAALWRFVVDSTNGGFLQFFCNWGTDTLEDVRAALETIGATRTRELVDDALRVIEPIGSSHVLDDLWSIAGLLSEGQRAELEAIDLTLWAAPDDIVALWAARHLPDD